MRKWQVAVIRTEMDVYEVDAKNQRDAAVQAGIAIGTGVEPIRTTLQSTKTLEPVSDPDKFVSTLDNTDDTSTESPIE